jgi:hypothetical protein
MTTIKSFTTLEQSRKLAEFLPIESADACWTNHLFDTLLSSWRIESTPPQEYKSLLDRFVVKGYLIEPAWSLAALISVLPLEIDTHKQTDGHKTYYYVESYMKRMGKEIYLSTERHENLVDACVAMVEKLNELNLL